MVDVRPHLALCAPAFGKIAETIALKISPLANPKIYTNLGAEVQKQASDYSIVCGATQMSRKTNFYGTRVTAINIGRTNAEVQNWIEENVINDLEVKIVFLSVAFCDFKGNVVDDQGLTSSGKEEPRLKTSNGSVSMVLTPTEKVVGRIRKDRKDIFLVAFKTTSGATEDEMFVAGLDLLKKNSCNLVVVNDVHTRTNMIVTPELTKYCVTKDRSQLVDELIVMSLGRASNNFTRTNLVTNVIDFHLQPWSQSPKVLQRVVDWSIEQGAYRAFNNVTVGHFGYKKTKEFLWSSRRKKNFNNVEDRDLVGVHFKDKEQQAYGAKPSAGARSQFIVLSKFDDLDCIIHFHCPLLPTSKIPQINAQRSQKLFECGSHECGKNTADGMVRVNKHLAVVMLDKHGPNIVFSQNARPEMVIKFIEENFDLTKRTE